MPLLDLFWTMLVLFLWIVWFWLLIMVFADIFRSRDLSGWGKAAWVLFTVLVPYLGVLVYLIARGHSMHERSERQAAEAERATRAYIQDVAGSSSADELAKLAQLRDSGALTDEEFRAQKSKLISA